MTDGRPPGDVDTDAHIVERVRRGDVQAYGALVERYERMLLAAALPVVRDVHAARDVVQDVFIQCFIKLPTIRDGSRVGAWLLKVAGREAVRAARRKRRMLLHQPALPPDDHVRVAGVDDDDPNSSSSRILCDDERRKLLECVRRLPAHERVAVALRYFEGRGVQEIARITGRPVGTVTKQLSRAIERLRGELQTTSTTTRESRKCQTTQPSTSS